MFVRVDFFGHPEVPFVSTVVIPAWPVCTICKVVVVSVPSKLDFVSCYFGSSAYADRAFVLVCHGHLEYYYLSFFDIMFHVFASDYW